MKIKRVVLYVLLLILLALGICFRNNSGIFYAALGNYYYKHNNIINAHKYYERAFEKGFRNSAERESYVNSIINSPLTLESQEKLVKIAQDDFQDAASARAKYFLYDLQREIHNKYPENYISQTSYNKKVVRWSALPITYCFKNVQGVPEEFIKEIKNAFSEWEKVEPLMFAEVKDDSANIIIEFEDKNNEKVEMGKKYVVAFTNPTINFNVLENMIIKFYIHSPDGKIFSPNQIYNTALHEIFHALGYLGHSYNPNNIMYLSKDSKILGNDERKTLVQADINTLKLLYKIQPDITNNGVIKGEYIPYLVLGGEEDLNISKTKEAKYYINHAPTLPGGYIDYAETLAGQGKYPQAIRTLEKAMSLSKTKDIDYLVFYNLAVCYYYIGHFEMSLDYANKAMEIRDTEELHFLLAEIYTKNNVSKAIEEYNKLILLSPENIEYVIKLANIYVKKHDYLNARKVLKLYLKKCPFEKNNKRLSVYGILLF